FIQWPRTALTSILGAPNCTPNVPASRASVISLAVCSSALDGMQPTCRHVPPGRSVASIIVTCRPLSAAKNAAEDPPGPAPRTSSWVSIVSGMGGHSGRLERRRLAAKRFGRGLNRFAASGGLRLRQHHPRVLEHLGQPAREAGGVGAVEDAVVV